MALPTKKDSGWMIVRQIWVLALCQYIIFAPPVKWYFATLGCVISIFSLILICIGIKDYREANS